jgi:hypothetical protein
MMVTPAFEVIQSAIGNERTNHNGHKKEPPHNQTKNS